MVRPIALRLTLPESKLLEAWVEARKRSDKSASASDVIRRALVAAAFAAHDRDEWTRIANEDRALEEWTARADSLLTVPWFEIDRRLAEARGSDRDRALLRERILAEVNEQIVEHNGIHTCHDCHGPLTTEDLEKHLKCPSCGAPSPFAPAASSEVEDTIPF